jgi:hypothetical protein
MLIFLEPIRDGSHNQSYELPVEKLTGIELASESDYIEPS